MRDVPTRGDLHRVKVLEHVRRSKWRVEWIEPNAGLIDFVSSRQILVPWEERDSLLRDEANAAALAAAVAVSGYPGDDDPVGIAISETLESSGEDLVDLDRGVLRYEDHTLQRVAARAGVAVPQHRLGYRDRHGENHLPWTCALQLAEAFARAEPRTVLTAASASERRWEAEAAQPGGSYATRTMARCRAASALIRQWAGSDDAIADRDARILEFQQLLIRTMWELRSPEPDVGGIAARIERALRLG